MRIINILVNGNIVSKDRDEIQHWLENALKNHYKFAIEWAEVKDDKKKI